MTKSKRYACSQHGCGRSFTRSDHLRRHMLNHSIGNSTCTRCRLHFKRPDLLHRHIARHQQKDRDAGGPGLGVVESRKKMWLDADGRIVSQRPTQSVANKAPEGLKVVREMPARHKPVASAVNSFDMDSHTETFAAPQPALSAESFEQFSLQHPELFGEHPFADRMLQENMFEFLANSSWGHRPPPVSTNQMDGCREFPESAIQSSQYMMTSHDRLFNMDSDAQMPFFTPEEFDAMTASYNCDSIRPSLQSSPHSRSDDSADAFLSPNHLGLDVRALSSPPNHLWTFFGVNDPVDSHYSSLEAPNISDDRSRVFKPTIDAESRERILKVIVAAQPKFPDGSKISRDHPLLSPRRMQTYLDLFFTYFNVAYPLFHLPTFDVAQTEGLLLVSIVLLGASYSDQSAHTLAVCIHDGLRAQLFLHEAFSATPELWVLQTLLLLDTFGKSRAGQRQHEAAHAFHGLLINLIRKGDYQSVRTPHMTEVDCNVQSLWRNTIEAEHRKRLAFICFLWDTQHALFFSQPLCMSALELRTTFPCSQSAWDAPTAEEWWELSKDETQVSFLTVLKAYMTADPLANYQLHALSHLIVLHGLMSMQWDMNRRSQTSLGMSISNVSKDSSDSWKETLELSYHTWKTDFDKYCRDMAANLPTNWSKRASFKRFTTAATAIYHAAHIALNIDMVDLQICAGARHITGRAVVQADHSRSWASLRSWIRLKGAKSATKAAAHAAQLLRDGTLNLKNWDVNEESHYPWCFHYPWCLYLATITCWAFKFALTASETPYATKPGTIIHGWPFNLSGSHDVNTIQDYKAAANAFLNIMANTTSANVRSILKHSSTSGLTALMAHHLSSVRWAVIHEAVKVLRGLE